MRSTTAIMAAVLVAGWAAKEKKQEAKEHKKSAKHKESKSSTIH
jgi:hypothetical protein